jgi:hypothetical protein
MTLHNMISGYHFEAWLAVAVIFTSVAALFGALFFFVQWFLKRKKNDAAVQ